MCAVQQEISEYAYFKSSCEMSMWENINPIPDVFTSYSADWCSVLLVREKQRNLSFSLSVMRWEWSFYVSAVCYFFPSALLFLNHALQSNTCHLVLSSFYFTSAFAKVYCRNTTESLNESFSQFLFICVNLCVCFFILFLYLVFIVIFFFLFRLKLH